MPSFNQSQYIGFAINSILRQDDPNWELWIIDNSTDDTPDIVRSYKDDRIKFNHIPERMDPGECINWALERADNRDFSYIHTDNLLAPNYVSAMRTALACNEFALAYCDLKSIDANGKYTGIFRRGKFDLARLFSFSSLGVPFSATTALARRIGGFSKDDAADDVTFCIRSFGIAEYVHIPEAIMDYRLHPDSRTTAHGGARQMQKLFLKAFLRLLPELVMRGIDPIDAVTQNLRALRLDIQLRIEDIWYREGHRTGFVLKGPPTLQQLWDLGLLQLPDLQSCQPRLSPRKAVQLKLLRGLRKIELIHPAAIQLEANRFRSQAIPWAVLCSGVADGEVRCWLRSADIYTIWVGKMLESECGWRIYISPAERAAFPSRYQIEILDLPETPKLNDLSLSMAANKSSISRLATTEAVLGV